MYLLCGVLKEILHIMDDDIQQSRNDSSFEPNNNNVTVDEVEGVTIETAEEKEGQQQNTPLNESWWNEDELDKDPHRMYFYDAYRSGAGTPELDDSTETTEEITSERKPLALMDEWEMWDYMDDETLKQRLKFHPELLEQITRKRKRKAALEDSDDDDLCMVMERHAKVTKYSEHAKVY